MKRPQVSINKTPVEIELEKSKRIVRRLAKIPGPSLTPAEQWSFTEAHADLYAAYGPNWFKETFHDDTCQPESLCAYCQSSI